MRRIARSAAWLTVGILLAASDARGQAIVLTDADPEFDIYGRIYSLMQLGLRDAGYEVHWLPEQVPAGENALELIFQVIDTDNGYDATFVLSALYHDEDLGILRDRPTILYQFHGFENLAAIADAALEDFLDRLEEEKALAEEEAGDGG